MRQKFLPVIFALLFLAAALQGAEELLKVPCLPQVQMNFDGNPAEPFWKEALLISKFRKLTGGADYGPGTELRLCRDQKNLYVALTVKSAGGPCVAAPGKGCWSGDNVEIFLAERAKHGWLVDQMALGSNGSVYCERISGEQWRGVPHITPDGWSAELIIPFAALRLDENKLYFNALNRRHREDLTLTWVRLPRFAHEPECFAKLDFQIPPESILHGPWTFEITSDQAGIAWETAAPCGGAVKFYPAGHPEAIREIAANDVGGISDGSRDLHSLVLTGLKPDTEYIYQLGGREYSFRTLAQKSADFSVAVTSDLHSHSNLLDTMLQRPDVQACDLFLSIGDQLTGSLGREALYEGFLDPLLRYWKKPFYVIRGNHEYRGPRQGTHFECFRNGEVRDYGLLFHKGICFVLLDGDGDGEPHSSPAYQQRQRRWLQKVVRSPEFLQAEYRVLLTHKPLCLQDDQTELGALLKTLPPETLARFDLSLAGHMHAWGKALPDEENFTSCNASQNGEKVLNRLPFPIFVNGAGTVMILKKEGQRLTLQLTETDGKVVKTLLIPGKRR